jgi:hypothetical protein
LQGKFSRRPQQHRTDAKSLADQMVEGHAAHRQIASMIAGLDLDRTGL